MPRRKRNAASAKAETPFTQTKDVVRIEMMKRIYVAKEPELTPDTWLHHPSCKDEGGKDAAAKCEALGCGAFSGAEVVMKIDGGWWNSLPGDH